MTISPPDKLPPQDPRRPRVLPMVSLLLLLLTLSIFVLSLARGLGAGSVHVVSTERLGVRAYGSTLEVRMFSAEEITGDIQSRDGWKLLGLGAYRLNHVTGYSESVSCPLWLLALLFAILPVREGLRLRRAKHDGIR